MNASGKVHLYLVHGMKAAPVTLLPVRRRMTDEEHSKMIKDVQKMAFEERLLWSRKVLPGPKTTDPKIPHSVFMRELKEEKALK